MKLVIGPPTDTWFQGDSGEPIELEPLREVQYSLLADPTSAGEGGDSYLLCRMSRTVTERDELGIWDGKTRHFDHVLLRTWPTEPGTELSSKAITPVLKGAPIDEIVDTGLIQAKWTHASIKDAIRCVA